MVRRCKEGCKIGPLFADDEQAAVALYTHLARFAAGGSLYLDAPENNPAVMVLVPKTMSVGLHGRISGHPARAMALARFLDYVQGHERIWICRWEEIARHWMREHPSWPGKQAGDEGNDR